MGGFATMDTETKCGASQCFILTEFIKEKCLNKIADIMPWHLDQYRKVKQVGNTDRAPILLTYKTFLSSWSSLTGKGIPAPKTLAEIYNEPIFILR